MTSFGNPGNRKGPSLRDLMRNNGGASAVPPARTPPPPPPEPEEDPWGDPPPLTDAFNRAAPEDTLGSKDSLGSRDDFGQSGSSELDHLLAENEELRNQNAEFIEAIENLRAQLESSSGQGGDDERTSLLDQMLEEKSETIRTLHVRIKELEQAVDENGGGGGPPMPTADREELAAMMDEIERERCQLEQERQTLDDDRRQLREDEEAMMRQMREMELQMAKERAELARQRNELQRLHAEIRHELELAQRDAAVNERLKMLQRRHQEVEEPGPADTGSRPPRPKSNSGVRPAVPPKPGQTPPKSAPPGQSNIFKRFLGGNGGQ